MAWVQLQFEVNAEQVERFSNILTALGAAAVTLLDAADQPLFEPPPGDTPLWPRTCINALFPATTNGKALLTQLTQLWAPEPLPPHRSEIVADQDWERAWMERFKPLCFGSRLWICPSWLPTPDPKAINILLDPGLAFGTGTHPTTALCLEWLTQTQLHRTQVIDYGCGSGILGIAALKLGAACVFAIDHDPQALLAARANATRNAVTAQFHTLSSPESLGEHQTDILVANILAAPLRTLAPRFADLLRSGGQLALSGITLDQIEALTTVYKRWFNLEISAIRENWALLAGYRR
jgi:ribosomal protein L11 methyltransferase